MAAVRTSRLPSSGCACRSRRQAISCGSTAATAASISAASRFTAMRVAGTASPGAMRPIVSARAERARPRRPGRVSRPRSTARAGSAARRGPGRAGRGAARRGRSAWRGRRRSGAGRRRSTSPALMPMKRVPAFGPLAAARLVGELGAALDRHLDVEQRGVVGTRGEQVRGDGGRGGAIAFEAELVEDAGEGIEDVVAVVDDEDAAGRRVAGLVVVVVAVDGLGRDRDRERRALAELASHLDRPPR